ncbi:MAG TPA: hypothetical protein VKT18_07190, partial [Acidimicrobiales bacterium]|nr:hypothetical protein [Acidimicrobiales bacterium]
TGTASASSSPSSTPTLDHFLCYTSRYSGPKAPPGIMLKNVIQPGPFTPAIGAANTHCNPANKLVGTVAYKVRNPLGHLLCFAIASRFSPVIVSLKNQFGTAVMKTTTTPTKLCLPTWKDNLGPPNEPVNQPPNLDHLTCYPVTAVPGAYAFHVPAIRVEDEFSAPKYVSVKLGVANLVCVPTTKILPTGLTYPPQSANDLSLVCFPSSPTPLWKLIYDQNQFGESVVAPTTTNESFCVPSQLSNQGPAA